MNAGTSASAPAFVAEFHDRLGYRPQDGHVLVVALDDARRPLWAATVTDMGEGMNDAQVTGAAGTSCSGTAPAATPAPPG